MLKIAIFASGSGSNAENIIRYFNQKSDNHVVITSILCNNSNAGVLERAKKLNIDTIVFNKEMFQSGEILTFLQSKKVDFLILAGFLWKIPSEIIKNFENKIINIHPALLPKYGGKGMYGDNVHKSVILNNEKESGITIHYVSENYDEGEIIFQASCFIEEGDNYELLAKKVHELEYKYFPSVIESVIFN